MKLNKKILKKKSFWIVCIAVIVSVSAGGFFVSARMKMKKVNGMISEAQSITVEKGTISNTVEGSGNLEAAETVGITVPTGLKAEEILVESGDQVVAGQTLAILNKASVTSALVDVENSLEEISSKRKKGGLTSLEKEELSEQQEELEEMEGKLTALRENPVITAAVDGIVGDISITEDSEITQGVSSGNSTSSGSTSSAQANAKQMTYQEASEKTSSGNAGKLLFLTANIGTKEERAENTEQKEDTQLKVIKDYSKLTIQAPVTGEIPQKTITETSTYTGVVTWNCNAETFQPASEYTAVIVLNAKSGYMFSEEHLPDIVNAEAEYEISDAGSILEITAKYEKTAEMQQTSGGQTSNGQATGNQNTNSAGVQGSSTIAGNGMSGGDLAASYVSGVSTSQNSVSSEYNSNYEVAAFTIQKQENVKVSVNVDELDILSVSEGQTAKITLDAIEGEEYEGTITKVASSASGGNGSTKYEVEITIPMNENMRIGMSASASIQVSEAQDVLTIPMTALQQRGEETFVYTEKDNEGNLSGEVVVETGLSDGQSVEILSGLEEGDTVYYTRTNGSSTGEIEFGGEMPGGGNMPFPSGNDGMPEGNGRDSFPGGGGMPPQN